MTTVYFGTNRKPNRKTKPDDFLGEFSEDGLANLRFGEAEVSAGGKIESITVYPENEKGTVLGSVKLFDYLRDKMQKENGDTLIYMHGYNVTFQAALLTGAILQEKSRIAGQPPLHVVVFSWPSEGSLTSYPQDRHNAKASGLAVARGMSKAVDFIRSLTREQACRRSMHLICHSMGNYVLRWAVQEMLSMQPKNLPRLFDQVILAAADEDDDTFELEHKLARLPELARRISVYFNRGDTALAASTAKGNPDRLGTDGPRNPRSAHPKTSLVDCSDVVEGTLEHSYYHESDRVVRDILEVLADKASDQIAGRQYVAQTNRYRLQA